MKVITLTPKAASEFLDTLEGKLTAIGIEIMDNSKMGPRDLRNVAEIMRETVLEFEEARLAAARKEKGKG